MGFADYAAKHPEVGAPVSDEGYAHDRVTGETIGSMQDTEHGILFWSKRRNTIRFVEFRDPAPDVGPAPEPTPLPAPEPPPPAPAPSPGTGGATLGVLEFGGHYDETNPALATVLAAGVRLVRVVPQRRQVLVERGRFNWTRADARIRPVLEAGAEALIVLTDGALIPTPLDPFVEFVEAIVNRYKGQRVAWEIWNEPGPDTGDPAAFAALVAETVRAIRAADPGAVVGAAAFHGQDLLRGFSWSWRTLSNPRFPLDHLDALSFHLIPNSPPPPDALVAQATATLRSLPAVPGQVWLTEVGYPSNPRFQANAPGYDGPDGQARWVTETLGALRSLPRVTRICWALLEDESANYGPDQAFGSNGLFTAHPGRQPKPSWEAFRAQVSAG
jgi:hypothetical protein